MKNLPREEYPRPQFVRGEWLNLNGVWSCEFDPGKSGDARGLCDAKGFSEKITVPFCPESRLSGLAHTDFIERMYYHRTLEIPEDWKNRRILLHFGAVDYSCEGFLDGKLCGRHNGGSVSFFFDLTEFVTPGKKHDFVLKVCDELRSGVQPVGKQCSAYKSGGCSYTRVTGIWQTVWMEPVAEGGLLRCRITPDLDGKAFHFMPEFFSEARGKKWSIRILADGKVAGEGCFAAATGVPATVPLDFVRPWSPEDPFLYDIEYTVTDSEDRILDSVKAYSGLRKIHIEGSRIFLNNKEIFLRLVLDQGYYPEGIWTAPSDADLKRDIELSMAAGFNGARLHQKVFEERFHYWADRLGYLTWGENATWGLSFCCSGNAKTPQYWESVFNCLSEWKEILLRDVNHPSIIAWSPLNESWDGGDFSSYRRVLTEVYRTTKQIDPTRPCNETSGGHHVKTDLWTVHLYRPDVKQLDADLFPKDKPVWTQNTEEGYHGQPYLNDEFGGFMYIPPERAKFADNSWGYFGNFIKSGAELCAKIAEQVELMEANPRLSGFCYTQLTDIEQEQNGVYNYDRTPKADPEMLRRAFQGKGHRFSD